MATETTDFSSKKKNPTMRKWLQCDRRLDTQSKGMSFKTSTILQSVCKCSYFDSFCCKSSRAYGTAGNESSDGCMQAVILFSQFIAYTSIRL